MRKKNKSRNSNNVTIVLPPAIQLKIERLQTAKQPAPKFSPFVAWLVMRGLEAEGVK